MYNPNLTRVCLLNVPLENDYKHTLWFDGKDQAEKIENQSNYFSNKIVSGCDFTGLTYQRKDNSIKVPKQYDEILGCNYVMYQNGQYNSKWFYAFITDIKYISDGVTEIFVETDVIQTWLTDYVVKTSFVEREHSYYDNVGENTYPEQVELGDYVVNKHSMSGYTGTANPEEYYGDYMTAVVAVSEYKNGEGEWVNATGRQYTNVYSGVRYYGFPASANGFEKLNTFINSYANGHIDAIQFMFLAPYQLTIPHDDGHIVGGNTIEQRWINNYNDEAYSEKSEVNMVMDLTSNTLDGYTPRNNKLMCFPYRYLNVSNNCGTTVIYQYEQFFDIVNNVKKSLKPIFTIKGCLTPGCSIRMTPKYYKGTLENDDESINMGKFPVLNWNSDIYTNWLTQNALNIGLSLTGDVAQIIGGGLIATATGGLAGIVGGSSIMSGIGGITDTIKQIHQMSFTPPQVKGNINNGDIITASGRNDFHFYDMSIKHEYARIIDGYFDMFGYKTCYVKVPYTNHRERYWYTKTIDVNIDGAIPNKDLQKIKDAYNNGITFWKNPSDIGNYPYYQNGTLYYSNNVTH